MRSPEYQRRAREEGIVERPRWPMIVLATPKGWTGPKMVDGKQVEGTFRSHQVPFSDMTDEHVELLDEWMRSYKPEELFDEAGALRPELAALAPEGRRRMGDNPHANGGLLLHDLELPDFRDFAVQIDGPGVTTAESTRVMGQFLAETMRRNLEAKNFRVFGPDETASNRLDAVIDVTPRTWEATIMPYDDRLSPSGPGHGDPQRAHHRRVDRGIPADRAPRLLLVLRGVHPHHLVHVQPARQVAGRLRGDPLAAPDRFAQLPADLPRLAAGPQRLLPPGPGFHRPRADQEGGGHPRLSAARRQHPAVRHRHLPAQPGARQRDRRRQAAGAPVARHALRRPALRDRHRHLGMGQQRPGLRARRGHGLRGRRADHGDPGGGRFPAQAHPRSSRSGWSTSSTS